MYFPLLLQYFEFQRENNKLKILLIINIRNPFKIAYTFWSKRPICCSGHLADVTLFFYLPHILVSSHNCCLHSC